MADECTTEHGGELPPPCIERLERIRSNWREVVEGLCFQFGYSGHDSKKKWLSAGGLSALEDAFEALGWDDPHIVAEGGCEHPGCNAWDTCGTPTPDGYKRLCGEHYRQVKARLAPSLYQGE